MIKGRPPRLACVFPNAPLYFVTFATRDRRHLSSLEQAQKAVVQYATRALAEYSIAVGRYVVMPDHLHLFVRGGDDFILPRWVAGLKRAISAALGAGHQLWQPGFFDHVLRSDESYGQKWLYVRDNPVRAGLVSESSAWPYQGEFVAIDRA
jgi:REP element-mobilizing transposase RayT